MKDLKHLNELKLDYIEKRRLYALIVSDLDGFYDEIEFLLTNFKRFNMEKEGYYSSKGSITLTSTSNDIDSPSTALRRYFSN